MDVHMYVCMYVRTYVCMYTQIVLYTRTAYDMSLQFLHTHVHLVPC